MRKIERPRRRLTAWLALAGLLLGAVDIWIAQLVGIEFQLAGKDATFAVFIYLAFNYSLLGLILGGLFESQRRERSALGRMSAQAEEIASTREQLAKTEKLAALGQLAGAIAHEVRNPLAIVRSSIQNAAEALPADSEGERSCRFALEEIDRLNRVITGLLSLARPLPLHRAPVAAEEIVERAQLVARRRFAERAIRLSAVTVGPLGSAEADRDLICQALLAILDNAAEAVPPGGEVRLEASTAPGEIELAVSDSGPGVPPENRARIFEPLFTTRDGGHGLGLAVAKQIVQAHGGRIEVGSSGFGGARFSIHLPRAEVVT